MQDGLRVLMITCEWPTPEHPEWAPFIVRQVQLLRSVGLAVDVFPFRGSVRPMNYLLAWRRVQTKLRQQAYDLVHAQWGQSGLLALWPKRLPLVVTFRGSDLNGFIGADGRPSWSGRFLQMISRIVARRADQIIVVSSGLVDRLPKGCQAHEIPSGIDLSLFRPMSQAEARQRLGLPRDRLLVLFAAQTKTPIKRHSLARKAVSALPPPLSAELLAVQNQHHHKMPLYMNACDALLLTSASEGSPNVVKEALACNTPVVSVDVGDVRQRIGSIEGCVVCADDSFESIASALAHVLSRKQRIDGRSAVQGMCEKTLTEEVISVYRQAVSRA